MSDPFTRNPSVWPYILGGAAVGAAATLVLSRAWSLASGQSEVAALLAKHSMKPHPEGGYYLETYRSALKVETPIGERSASTAITFLITPGSVSRLHRLQADEVWHFYEGGPMTVVELDSDADGQARRTIISRDNPQHVVPAGTWFGSFPNAGSPFSFVGCTVAPGFEFADFELASRARLLTEFPQAAKLVVKLTKGLP